MIFLDVLTQVLGFFIMLVTVYFKSFHYRKKLVSCLCPCSNFICFLCDFAFPVTLPLELFIPVVSLSRRIRFAGGFESIMSSLGTCTFIFSLSHIDSFKVLFLLWHFGVPSKQSFMTLFLWDEIISVLIAAPTMWSLLLAGPILMLTAGLAQFMSPHTFL